MAAVAMLMVGGTACRSQAAASRPSKYDGQWWGIALAAEREGFVAGFLDCYKFEFNGPAQFETKSIMAYSDLISEYFAADSVRRIRPLALVLPLFADHLGEKASTGGEAWHEPHSYFDGNYWRQAFAAGGVAAQRGFVEGYLVCNDVLAHSQRGSFSATPADYVSRVNRWYQFDPDNGDMEPGRVKTKIADVLFRFRDPQ